MENDTHGEIPAKHNKSSVTGGVILLLLSVPLPLLAYAFLLKCDAGEDTFWGTYCWFWNSETEMRRLLLYGVSAFLAFVSWRNLRKRRTGGVIALVWFLLVLALLLFLGAVRGVAAIPLLAGLLFAVLFYLPRELWKRWRFYAMAAGVLLIGIAAVCFCPSIPQYSRYVSVPHSEMRSLATAVEAYAVDNEAYPPWTIKPEEQAFFRGRRQMPSFRRFSPGGTAMLTTPIAFITDFPRDYFSYLDEDRTYAYWAPEGKKERGWITWSPGPDGVFDINPETLPKVYDPDQANPSTELLFYTWDPTNGYVSAGDIWRVKQ